MTAEITSRHVSCGILTNYETFSLFHHPEDRCDEIFVHAFTTSDGRSQPDAVIGSPLGFMLAVTLLVVRDRGLEWDLGLVEEEEEVERGDDRPGVGRGQGPGDVMDRHGAGGSGSSGAPVLGSWVDRYEWTFNPRTGDPGSERPMGRVSRTTGPHSPSTDRYYCKVLTLVLSCLATWIPPYSQPPEEIDQHGTTWSGFSAIE